MNGKNSSRCLDKKIQFGLHAKPSQSVVQKSLPTIRSQEGQELNLE